MRLLLTAGALLLLASPAFAQRVDTRRYDIADNEDSVRCRFRAIDTLGLLVPHGPEGGPIAQWFSAKDDHALLSIDFVPGADKAATVLGLNLAVPQLPGLETTRLYIDGKDSHAVLERDDSPLILFRAFDGSAALVAQMMTAREIRFDLIDARGKTLRGYRWDISKLRRVPELLELVQWSCNSPDRG